MTRSMLSIGGATREMTQNLLSINSGLCLTNQVLHVIEALPRVEETLFNLCHVFIPGRRALTWMETVGILVL